MVDVTTPTHSRLMTKLKAIGPYLRDTESSENSYLFDCFSVCVNHTKSPEEREFWGWWLELKQDGRHFLADYRYGLFDFEGVWLNQPIPENIQGDVENTLIAFHRKLTTTLNDSFDSVIEFHQNTEVQPA